MSWKYHRLYKQSTRLRFLKVHSTVLLCFLASLSYDKSQKAADSFGHRDSCYAWLPQNELFRLTFRFCIIYQNVPQCSAEGFKRLFQGALVPQHSRIRCISPSGRSTQQSAVWTFVTDAFRQFFLNYRVIISNYKELCNKQKFVNLVPLVVCMFARGLQFKEDLSHVCKGSSFQWLLLFSQ